MVHLHCVAMAITITKPVVPNVGPAKAEQGAVERVVQLLYAVARHGRPVTVRKLHDLTGLPHSTLYRHLQMLKRWGFVQDSEWESRYEPGPMCYQLTWGGSTAMLARLAHEMLVALVHSTGESAGLVVAVQTNVVCLDMVDSPQSLRCSFQRGSEVPLSRGASAKAQLAFMPEREAKTLLKRLLPDAKPENKALRDSLHVELAAIRKCGYAVSEGEVDWGVWGVSAPVLSKSGRLLGGVSLMAPAVRAQGRHETLIRATLDACAQICRQL